MQNEALATRTIEDTACAHEYTISDLARIYGVSLRTLRFYEDRGLLKPRRQGTSRFYSPKDRIRLELILKGKRLGFTLSEIYDLIVSRTRDAVETEDKDLTVSLGRQQIASQIAHLERQRSELDAAIDELQRAYQLVDEPVAG